MVSRVGRPETLFVESPKGFIGYQVFGQSSPDIVFITGWMTNVDMYWDEPSAIRYLARLGEIGRVLLIDKRGSGVSDHSTRGYIDPVEDTLDDVRAVLDAEESEEAILIGDTEGGLLACILAASYPERFPTLILVNSYARLARADDYPSEPLPMSWRPLPGVGRELRPRRQHPRADRPHRRQGSPFSSLVSLVPKTDHGPVGRQEVSRVDSRDQREIGATGDPGPDLGGPPPRCPLSPPAVRRVSRKHIPGAELRLVEGADTFPFHAGDPTEALEAIEAFVTGRRGPVRTDRMLATVLFSDIVGSTSLASESGDDRWLDARQEHNRIVRLQLERFRGKEVNTTGDGFVAMFDGPLRAIQCAQVMVTELRKIGLEIRVGIHTGEVEMRGDDIGGVAVHIGARVMAEAASGGIMASGTVKDLVIGSNMEFADCGTFELKGVPGSWNLYEVRSGPA